MIALSNSIGQKKQLDKLNLADNSITDYGMHSVKNILKVCPQLKCRNLASNMISGAGLELIADDLCQNDAIKVLDLGVLEASMRKNSLGVGGA